MKIVRSGTTHLPMRRMRGGYTLVEIAVAVLIIGLGFVSVLAVFTTALRWSQQAMAGTSAPLAMKNFYEKLVADYQNPGGAFSLGSHPLNNFSGNHRESNYFMRLLVAAVPNPPGGSANDRTLYRVVISCYTQDPALGAAGGFSATNDWVGHMAAYAFTK